MILDILFYFLVWYIIGLATIVPIIISERVKANRLLDANDYFSIIIFGFVGPIVLLTVIYFYIIDYRLKKSQ